MSKYRVDYETRKWTSGGYCEEVFSEEVYKFSSYFDSEIEALVFIENEEYHEDEEGNTYIIISKTNPIIL